MNAVGLDGMAVVAQLQLALQEALGLDQIMT